MIYRPHPRTGVIDADFRRANEAIIAANDSADRRGRGVVTVVPLTSNVTAVYPFQVLLRAAETGLPVDSKAQAEQVRSISTDRLLRLLGRVPADRLWHLDAALRLHLSL